MAPSNAEARAPAPVLRLLVLVLVVGVLSGVAGAALTLLLRLVEHVAFGYSGAESFLIGVEHAPPWRRVLGVTSGSLLAGLLWWWLRQRPIFSMRTAVADRSGSQGYGARRRAVLDAAVQILAVGTGTSVGREGAPRQAAAVIADQLAVRLTIPGQWRRLLVASAAGAGLAAVYNVPLSGVVFAVEILLPGVIALRWWQRLLVAVPVSGIATVTAWPVVHNEPLYHYTDTRVTLAMWAWAILAVPVTGLVGMVFSRIMKRATAGAPGPSWRLPAALGLAGLTLGALAVLLPQLTGNGKGLVEYVMAGNGTPLVFALLFLLKPAVTAMALRAGAKGGLITPSVATGAALGAAVALTLGLPGEMPGFAIIAAVGVLAVSQDAPWFAALMGWEMTHAPLVMLLPLLVAAHGAYLFSHRAIRRWPSVPSE